MLQSDGTSDEVKREQMERLVREELERWDSETSFTPQPSGRGASPSSTGRGGPRSRSRPGSGGNAVSNKVFLKSRSSLIWVHSVCNQVKSNLLLTVETVGNRDEIFIPVSCWQLK